MRPQRDRSWWVAAFPIDRSPRPLPWQHPKERGRHKAHASEIWRIAALSFDGRELVASNSSSTTVKKGVVETSAGQARTMRNRTLQTLCGCSSALEAGDVETPDPARFGLTDGSPERCKDRSSENLTDSAWLASWLCMNRSVVIKPCGLVDRLGVLYKKKTKTKTKRTACVFPMRGSPQLQDSNF